MWSVHSVVAECLLAIRALPSRGQCVVFSCLVRRFCVTSASFCVTSASLVLCD